MQAVDLLMKVRVCVSFFFHSLFYCWEEGIKSHCYVMASWVVGYRNNSFSPIQILIFWTLRKPMVTLRAWVTCGVTSYFTRAFNSTKFHCSINSHQDPPFQLCVSSFLCGFGADLWPFNGCYWFAFQRAACERQTYLFAHRRRGTRNVPQRRWARRNVSRPQAI